MARATDEKSGIFRSRPDVSVGLGVLSSPFSPFSPLSLASVSVLISLSFPLPARDSGVLSSLLEVMMSGGGASASAMAMGPGVLPRCGRQAADSATARLIISLVTAGESGSRKLSAFGLCFFLAGGEDARAFFSAAGRAKLALLVLRAWRLSLS